MEPSTAPVDPTPVAFKFDAPKGPVTLEAMLACSKYNSGRDLINAGSFDEAIDHFTGLLKEVTADTDEVSPASAPVYYQYGAALVLKAEESSSVFAEGLADKPNPEEDGGGEWGEGEGTDQSEAGVMDAVKDTVEANAAVVEDLEVAWEVLEVAKNILAPLADDVPEAKVHGPLQM